MAGDLNKPTGTSTYLNFPGEIRDNFADQAKMFDGTSTANLPTNTIRWSATNKRFEKYNGSTWAALETTYLINADQVDGYHAGNASGNIPVSNGTVCTTLNADKVDGYHAGTSANQVLLLNSSGLVPLGNIPTTLTGKDADSVDGFGASATATANTILPLNSSAKIASSVVAFRGALVAKTSNQTFTTAVAAQIAWDVDNSEIYDTLGISFPGSGHGFSIPSGILKLRFHAQITWETNATGRRELYIINGTTGQIVAYDQKESVTTAAQQVVTPVLSVTAGHTYYVYALQASGGDLDIVGHSTTTPLTFGIEVIE